MGDKSIIKGIGGVTLAIPLLPVSVLANVYHRWKDDVNSFDSKTHGRDTLAFYLTSPITYPWYALTGIVASVVHFYQIFSNPKASGFGINSAIDNGAHRWVIAKLKGKEKLSQYYPGKSQHLVSHTHTLDGSHPAYGLWAGYSAFFITALVATVLGGATMEIIRVAGVTNLPFVWDVVPYALDWVVGEFGLTLGFNGTYVLAGFLIMVASGVLGVGSVMLSNLTTRAQSYDKLDNGGDAEGDVEKPNPDQKSNPEFSTSAVFEQAAAAARAKHEGNVEGATPPGTPQSNTRQGGNNAGAISRAPVTPAAFFSPGGTAHASSPSKALRYFIYSPPTGKSVLVDPAEASALAYGILKEQSSDMLKECHVAAGEGMVMVYSEANDGSLIPFGKADLSIQQWKNRHITSAMQLNMNITPVKKEKVLLQTPIKLSTPKVQQATLLAKIHTNKKLHEYFKSELGLQDLRYPANFVATYRNYYASKTLTVYSLVSDQGKELRIYVNDRPTHNGKYEILLNTDNAFYVLGEGDLSYPKGADDYKGQIEFNLSTPDENKAAFYYSTAFKYKCPDSVAQQNAKENKMITGKVLQQSINYQLENSSVAADSEEVGFLHYLVKNQATGTIECVKELPSGQQNYVACKVTSDDSVYAQYDGAFYKAGEIYACEDNRWGFKRTIGDTNSLSPLMTNEEVFSPKKTGERKVPPATPSSARIPATPGRFVGAGGWETTPTAPAAKQTGSGSGASVRPEPRRLF
jgi:hypothetical protein